MTNLLDKYKFDKKIPKIIHQIWIGDKPTPFLWINTWRFDYIKQNPNWKYKLWTEHNIDTLKYLDVDMYQKEKEWAGKADIIRLAILKECGGVYIDADSIWINNKSLDKLINESNKNGGFFAGWEDENNLIANGVFGCYPYHPVLDNIIKIQKLNFKSREGKMVWESIGPVAFTQGINISNSKDYIIFPNYYFYPESWHHNDEKFTKIDPKKFLDSYMYQFGYSTNNYGNNQEQSTSENLFKKYENNNLLDDNRIKNSNVKLSNEKDLYNVDFLIFSSTGLPENIDFYINNISNTINNSFTYNNVTIQHISNKYKEKYIHDIKSVCITIDPKNISVKESLNNIKKLGFKNIEIIEGVNGKNLFKDDLKKYLTPRAFFELTNGRYVHEALSGLGSVGAYLSHMKCWEKCVELNEDLAIFEDDITLVKNYDPINLQKAYRDAKQFNYDILRLTEEVRHYSFGKDEYVTENIIKNKVTQHIAGYIITPRAASILLKYKITSHVDFNISFISDFENLNHYCVVKKFYDYNYEYDRNKINHNQVLKY